MSDESGISLRNCTFQFKCQQTWDGLLRPTAGSDPDKRLCTECRQLVHLVQDDGALKEALRNNWCVAIPTALLQSPVTEDEELGDCDDLVITVGVPRGLRESPVNHERPSATDPFDGTDEMLTEIHEWLFLSHRGEQGYGGQKKAAALAVQTFGRGWLDPSPSEPADRLIRQRLRLIVNETTPPSHSNRHRVWSQFCKYARELAES